MHVHLVGNLIITTLVESTTMDCDKQEKSLLPDEQEYLIRVNQYFTNCSGNVPPLRMIVHTYNSSRFYQPSIFNYITVKIHHILIIHANMQDIVIFLNIDIITKNTTHIHDLCIIKVFIIIINTQTTYQRSASQQLTITTINQSLVLLIKVINILIFV